MNLGKKIKFIRENQKLSQNYMAQLLNMSRPSYDKVESGEKDLTIKEIEIISKELNLTFDDLINDAVSELSESYNEQKYKEMIRRFIKRAGSPSDGRITKTKLAKLLYLLDFAWYYDHLESISGLRYRRIAQGPVPDEYFRVIDEMLYDGEISIKISGNAMMIGLNEELDNFNNDYLSKEQDEKLSEIANQWQASNTQTIVNFTHSQLPWKLSNYGELIPYESIIQESPDHVYKR